MHTTMSYLTQNYTKFRLKCLPRSGYLFKMFLVGMLEEDVMFWQNGRTEKEKEYLNSATKSQSVHNMWKRQIIIKLSQRAGKRVKNKNYLLCIWF